MKAPLTPITYLFVWLALLVLTLLTTLVAFVDLGFFSLAVAILFSIAKTTLIVLFFMHMIRTFALDRVIAFSGLIWFFIMISLIFTDYITRSWNVK